MPDRLFDLPKHNPKLWLLIMLFYPIWSAFTQELIYRSFFFHRYISLFSNQKILIVANGLLFGFLHIIFKNWVAVIGSALIGLMWASSYARHKSLMLVFIEHSFVGNLLYTFGLGAYFYVPDF
jgi:membrane protease YdiL (CAAX protease family)